MSQLGAPLTQIPGPCLTLVIDSLPPSEFLTGVQGGFDGQPGLRHLGWMTVPEFPLEMPICLFPLDLLREPLAGSRHLSETEFSHL